MNASETLAFMPLGICKRRYRSPVANLPLLELLVDVWRQPVRGSVFGRRRSETSRAQTLSVDEGVFILGR